MALYRKKPDVVKALQWTGSNNQEIEAFVGVNPNTDESYFSFDPDVNWAQVWIDSRGSWLSLEAGDYVVQDDPQGFFTMKPDEFTDTYEAI